MQNNLAPVCLFVYNRLIHTKKTIESLKKNTLSSESELFIFSDGPKNEEVIKAVQEVRDYIKSIEGFKKITIINAEVNKGLAISIIEGVKKIINRFGKIIVLEDDLITSPLFLTFMNKSLDFYENEDKVFTISGYSNIELPNKFKDEVYFSHISSTWGWASWAKEWNSINWEDEYIYKISKDKKLLKQIKRKIGSERVRMLKYQLTGKINSWAVKRLFYQVMENKFTVFPIKTFINNIGHDGSGVHCSVNGNIDSSNKLSESSPEVYPNFREDSEINRVIYTKNNFTFIGKVYTVTVNRLMFYMKKNGIIKK